MCILVKSESFPPRNVNSAQNSGGVKRKTLKWQQSSIQVYRSVLNLNEHLNAVHKRPVNQCSQAFATVYEPPAQSSEFIYSYPVKT